MRIKIELEDYPVRHFTAIRTDGTIVRDKYSEKVQRILSDLSFKHGFNKWIDTKELDNTEQQQ